MEINDQNLQTSIERLSTGLRINTPGDDPAGSVIANGLKSSLGGISQSVQNSQNGINLANTADGAMSQIATMLLHMRSVAVNAANEGVNDTATLQADQTQIQGSLQSINQIAQSTKFDGLNLLNGASGVTAALTDGADVSSVYVGTTFGGAKTQTGPVTIQQVTPATAAQITLSKSFAAGAPIGAVGTITVNGYAVQVAASDTIANVANAINSLTGQTGVNAQVVANGGGLSIQLNQGTYGANFGINYTDSANVLSGSATANSTGTNGVYNVSATTNAGVKSVTFTGGQNAGQSGLYLTDANNNVVVVTPTGNSGLTTPTEVAALEDNSIQFQLGPDASDSVSYSMPNMQASSLGTTAIAGQSLANVNVLSPTGAQNAIQIIDAAIAQVSTLQGALGSFQSNILNASSQALSVTSQNVTASLSTIQDIDSAAEMTNYTKLQVLQQTGVAMLSQANQTPQQLLSLLKNI